MSNIIQIPKILLPNDSIDFTKWAVVACDQFTSEPEYWEELAKIVGDAPSTLDMILPEVYLTSDNQEKIDKINNAMHNYLESDFFKEIESMVLVKRTLDNGDTRLGLMLAIDLDAYEYTPKNTALIKATEKTVEERIPPRLQVRQNACLEVPHIMLLIDDPQGEIIESLYADSDIFDKLYDFELNMNGGHITGFKVENSEDVIDKINSFLVPEYIRDRYNSDHGMLFAVGDGNHSLATAKECWNNIKANLTEEERKSHPARYALCELVNLHDESLVFEPIHRLIFGAGQDFIDGMMSTLHGEGRIRIRYNGENYSVAVPENPSDAIKDIQDYIDKYISSHEGVRQDYIHGDETLSQLVKKNEALGIFMPTLSKSGFFDYVVRRGVLPRKSFSMGVANDKRYYLECRKIAK